MPSANKADTPLAIDVGEIEGRYASLGDYTVGYETFKQDLDPAPLFRGLPDDRCQCPHWGVVTGGSITLRWKDHMETYVAGDAYFAPPGHLPLVTAGTSIVEFSPSVALRQTMAAVEQNIHGAGVVAE